MTGRTRKTHALKLCWGEPHAPLPLREISGPKRVVPWFDLDSRAGSLAPGPFNFCDHIQHLMHDIAARCPEFGHLQVPRILVSVTQARGSALHGLQARVTPLRFQGGALIRKRRGVLYGIQRLFHLEHEYLYLMTFVLPRFLDQDFDRKLVTLFHEMHHIGPAFDGDLRRYAGRYAFHSHSRHAYDEHMAELAREYLASRPDPRLFAFLRLNFSQLQARCGSVTGFVVPRPKIIPLVAPYVA
jgi:hypothetical protein